MKKTYFYIIIFIIHFLIGCKNPVSSPEGTPKEYAKFKVAIVGDATIRATMDKSENDIASTVLQGIQVDIDSVIILEVTPTTVGRAVLWTGGDIDDSIRRDNKIRVKVSRDTEIRVVIGPSSSPVDTYSIILLMSDNGHVLVNGDKRTVSSDKIMLAKGQIVEMKAVPNTSYYFSSWEIGNRNSVKSEESFIMDNDKSVVVSFRAISIGSKLKLKINGGSVSVNGSTYTENSELVFPIGTKLTITANGNSENETSGFVGWGGNINHLDNPEKNSVSLTMDSDIFLEPIFGNKTGTFYLSFFPSELDSGVEVIYTKGSTSSALKNGANSIENLNAGDIITLEVRTGGAPTGYETVPTWFGAGGYGVSSKTTILFEGKSAVTSVIFKPVKYSLTFEIKKYIDATDNGSGVTGGILEADTSVGGYSITVDGVTYRDVGSFVRNFDANSKLSVSLNTGNNYTNVSFNGDKASTETNDFLLNANSIFKVDLGHVSRELSLNIIGGKRTINAVDYISSIRVDNSGYTDSDKEYKADKNDGEVVAYPVKVLSGRSVKFTAILSGGHSFVGYEQLDVTNGYTGAFTNATWNKTITSTFASSEIWDGMLSKEPTQNPANTYIVNVPSELAWVAQTSGTDDFLNKTINIMLDLDMASKPFSGIGIGNKDFQGTINGNGKQIKNLYITAGVNVGLVGKLGENGKVDGVYVSSGNLTLSGGSSIGAIVGSNFKGTITNSTNNAFIDASAGEIAGGIVGFNNQGYVANSQNLANIIGFRQIGGVVGRTSGGIVSNVGNTGKIFARPGGNNGNYFGGVVGRNILGTITMAYNSGAINITNASHVGGIAGANEGAGARINKVYNSGIINVRDINSSVKLEFIGGIIGYDLDTAAAGGIDEVRFSHAYNTGRVSGQNSTGGIVGTATRTSKWAYVFNIGGVIIISGPNTRNSVPGPVIGEVVDTITLQDVYYLKNNYANSSSSSGAGTYPIASEPNTTPRTDSEITVSGLGLGAFNDIWEDKTPKDSLNGVKKRPMIKGLGEYNTVD